MKHTFTALCFVIFIFSACKPKTESKNGFDLPGDNTSTTEKKRNWSDDYRKSMRSEIHDYARKHSIPNTLDYGICVIDALEIKFPEGNVDKLSAEAQQILQNCKNNNTQSTSPSNQSTTNISAQWSAADQKEFMDGCTPDAIKSLNERAGNEYCDCMLKKLMQEYPNIKEVEKAPQNHLMKLAMDCKKQVWD